MLADNRKEHGLPCAEQDHELIKAWMREHGKPGLIVPVLTGTTGLFNEYLLDEITNTNPGKGRIYLHRHGAFYLSGKNCFSPKGKINMVVPTEPVLTAAMDRKQWTYNGSIKAINSMDEAHKEMVKRVREQLAAEDEIARRATYERLLSEKV